MMVISAFVFIFWLVLLVPPLLVYQFRVIKWLVGGQVLLTGGQEGGGTGWCCWHETTSLASVWTDSSFSNIYNRKNEFLCWFTYVDTDRKMIIILIIIKFDWLCWFSYVDIGRKMIIILITIKFDSFEMIHLRWYWPKNDYYFNYY